MAQPGSTGIGGAHVTITADTAQARAEIDKFGDDFKAKAEALRKELFGFFDDIKAKQAELGEESEGASVGIDPVKAAAAGFLIRETAEKAFKLGRELREFYDSLFPDPSRLKDALDVVAGSASEQVKLATQNIKTLQKELLETTEIANFAENTLGIGDRQKKINEEIQAEQKTLRRAIAAQRKQQIEEDIEAERIAVASGAEKIEASRQNALARAREKYKQDEPEVIAAINRRYNEEIRRFEEAEAKKKQAEEEREARRKQAEDERAAREKQHAEERERREREALERLARQQQEIADKTAAAIASAFSKARTDFASALSMKDLVIGVQALNANLDNMRRNRQQIAAGDIYSG